MQKKELKLETRRPSFFSPLPHSSSFLFFLNSNPSRERHSTFTDWDFHRERDGPIQYSKKL